MAYYNRTAGRNRYYGKRRLFGQRQKKTYTKAEKIAFDLGQRDRVVNSLNTGKTDNRVYEAYCKGCQGIPTGGRSKKPLFAD